MRHNYEDYSFGGVADIFVNVKNGGQQVDRVAGHRANCSHTEIITLDITGTLPKNSRGSDSPEDQCALPLADATGAQQERAVPCPDGPGRGLEHRGLYKDAMRPLAFDH